MHEDSPKPLISSTVARARFGVTNDYITLLCRQNKVQGKLLGRIWYVEPESLGNFLKQSKLEREAQRARLSQEFKRELEIKKSEVKKPEVEKLVETPLPTAARVLKRRLPHAWPAHFFATSAAFFIGVVISQALIVNTGAVFTPPQALVAPHLSIAPPKVHGQYARISNAFFAALRGPTPSLSSSKIQPLPLMKKGYSFVDDVLGVVALFKNNSHTENTQLAAVASIKPISLFTLVTTKFTPSIQVKTNITPKPPAAPTYVTQASLLAQLQKLTTSLRSEISKPAPNAYAQAGLQSQINSLWSALALTNRIDNISNVTITNSTIAAVSSVTELPYFASTTIGDGTQAGGLTINGGATTTGNTKLQGTLAVSTVTNCSGSTALTTDSSGTIGCSAITASAGAFPFTQTTFGSTNANSTSTLIGFTNGIYTTASSTIGNGSATGGLTVSGTATATNIILTSATGAAGCATFSSTGALSNTGVACGTGAGGGSFPFTPTAIGNSTSTLLQFTAGFISSASSTIGNGTATGGLTVAGTATATNLTLTSVTSSLLKTNSAGSLVAAVAGTDYTNFAWPFTPAAWGNATGTLIGFSNGIISNASSTFASTLFLSSLTSGELAVDSTGKVYKGATTTDSCSSGISCSFSNGTETFTNTYGFPFTPTALGNATGTLLQLTAGVITSASSTIGGGTNTTGLTIAGGATTTGTSYHFGNVGIGTTSAGTPLSVTGAGVFTGTVTAPQFFATSTVASTFPFASTTAISGTISQFTTASSTNLTISGVVGGLLKTSATGLVSIATAGTDYQTFAWPFTPTALGNATGTLLQLTAGVITSASSTIGGGTNTTGLTIAGGATTTGTAYFQSNVGIGTTSAGTPLSVTGAGVFTGTLTAPIFFATSTTASTFTFASTTSFTFTDTASTSRLVISNAISGLLKTSATGLVSVATPNTDYDIFAWLFNPTSFGGTLVSATTSILDLQGGLYASSTVQFGNAGTSQFVWNTTTGSVGIGTTSPYAMVSVVATSTSGLGSPRSLFVIASTTSAFATSTLFSVNNIGSTTLFQIPSALLKTDTSGTIIGAIAGVDYARGNVAFEFTPTALGNATGTLLQLTAGVITSASSTIGSGTNTTGLTIAGGATTTGLAIFQSNVGIGTTSAGTPLSVTGAGVFTGTVTAPIFFATSTISASTFAFASTTSFTFTDTASTSRLVVTNALNGLLKTSASGAVSVATPNTDYDVFAWLFNPTSFGGTIVSATTSILALQGGLYASSTVQFGNAGTSQFVWNTTTGSLGIGTTSPYAMVSIVATSTSGLGSPQTLFAIASTTSTFSTTTLFSISNIGSTTLGNFGACAGTSALTTNSGGTIACGAISATFPFTASSYGGAAANSTTTPLLLTGAVSANSYSLIASSTFATFASTTQLTVSGGLMYFSNSATTTIPNNQNAYAISTSTAVGNSPIMSIANTSPTSTVSFFTSTSTGLVAGAGVSLGAGYMNALIIGGGKIVTDVTITNGSLCVSGAGWCTASSTGGSVAARAFNTMATVDIAEMYLSTQTLQPGQIVAAAGDSNVALASQGGGTVLGVVSTRPGFTLGYNGDNSISADMYPIALAGRVPVRVTLDNGRINVGDRIALSTTTPGAGMRAGYFDSSVGIALESYNGDSMDNEIMMFVGIFPSIDYSKTSDAIRAGFASSSAELADTLSSALSGLTALLQTGIRELGVAVHATVGIFDKIFAKEIHTDTFHTQNLCVRKSDGSDVCITGDELAALLAAKVASASTSSGSDTTGTSAPTEVPKPPKDTQAPTLTIQGNNPAILQMGDAYNDLGVTVADDIDQNLGFTASVDNATSTSPDQIVVDTTIAGTHTIFYSATDQAGNIGTAQRTIQVIDKPTEAATTTPAVI